MSGLQPTCLLCFSTCDKEGCLTSCDHYFCSRCASRLPDPASGAPCPLCRKPFRTVRLDHTGVQQLMADPLPGIQSGLKAFQHHIAHHRQTAARLKEALRLVHNRYTASAQRITELEQTSERLREENAQLRQQIAAFTTAPPRPSSREPPDRGRHVARSSPQTARVLDLYHTTTSPAPARTQWSSAPRPTPTPSPSRPLFCPTPVLQPCARGPAPTGSVAAPLGWAATGTAAAKRPRSHSSDHSARPPQPPSTSTHGQHRGGAWESTRLSDPAADGASQSMKGYTGHQDSLSDFRISTPLAQSLQNRRTEIPASAVVPPSPRLFAGAAVPSAPKPLQGLLDACFRTPR